MVMADTASRIAKNTTYLTMALVIQKVIAFFFFLIIARQLGGEGTGIYISAFSFAAFFGVFVDLGLAPVITREIARKPEKTTELLRATVSLKLFLSAAVYLCLLAVVYLLKTLSLAHPPLEVVAVAGLIMILDSFVLTGSSVFRGWQNLWFESVVVIVNKVAVFAFGLLVLWLAPSAFAVAIAILCGGIASFFLLTHYLGLRIQQPWWPRIDTTAWKKLLSMATPFAVAAFFATAYAHFDSILLTILKGNEAVGLYSVASKTMNAFTFIPSAFAVALYPAMSADYRHSAAHLTNLLEQSLRYLLLLSAPIAAGLFLFADFFVRRLGADYAESAIAVQILMPSLIFVFLSYPFGALLNATDRQHWQTTVIASGMILNTALNIFLIPAYSFIGASISWFITNMMVIILAAVLAKKVVNYRLYPLIITTLRTSLAIALMTFCVILLRPLLSELAIIPIAALSYIMVLFITREVSAEDWRGMLALLRNPRLDDQPTKPIT